jgi:hypothetical protein
MYLLAFPSSKSQGSLSELSTSSSTFRCYIIPFKMPQWQPVFNDVYIIGSFDCVSL